VDLGTALKVLHAISGALLLGGLLARWVSLRAAFRDRAVLAAHVFELGGAFVVFGLMVGKPF